VPRAIFEEWVQERWPEYEHVVVFPVEGAVEELVAMGCERVGGYSLGALLILNEWSRFEGKEGLMLAPYFSFCCERDRGGEVKQSDLKSLQLLMGLSAKKGLRFFYDFSKMSFLKGPLEEGLPYEVEGLLWGLDQLGCLQVEDLASVKNLRFVFGDEDVFIQAPRLAALCEEKGIRYELKLGVGHDFRSL